MSSCSKIDDGGQGNTGGEFENSSIELGAGVEQEIILESDGGSKIIRFTAPQNWHVELAGESDWLVLSPVEGDAGTGRGLVSGSRRNEVPKGGWSEAELWRSLPTTLCLPIERKKPTLLGRLHCRLYKVAPKRTAICENPPQMPYTIWVEIMKTNRNSKFSSSPKVPHKQKSTCENFVSA